MMGLSDGLDQHDLPSDRLPVRKDHSHDHQEKHEHSGDCCGHDHGHKEEIHEHGHVEKKTGGGCDHGCCGHDHDEMPARLQSHDHDISDPAPAGFDPVAFGGVDLSGDGGLYKKILVEGNADKGSPLPGAKVKVHYVGTLLDGSKFDSSRDRPGFFEFNVGIGQVIKGWDQGICTMKKGEKCILACRSDYAYGEHGSPPKIPGGATLLFEVELFSWKEKKKEKHQMSPLERFEEAEKLKVCRRTSSHFLCKPPPSIAQHSALFSFGAFCVCVCRRAAPSPSKRATTRRRSKVTRTQQDTSTMGRRQRARRRSARRCT